MPAFSSQISINAPSRRVFDFISKVENMPRYLPTLKKATQPDEDHVHFEGRIHGHPYSVDGWFSCDPGALSLSWGSPPGPGKGADYSGEIQVFDTDEGSELACRIEFPEDQERMNRLAGPKGDAGAFIETNLDAVLACIKKVFEGKGPKDSHLPRRPRQG